MKTDGGFKESEKLLNELEEKIHREYAQAAKEMGEKVDAYFAKFEKENAKMEQAVRQGRMSAKEYNDWRMRKMATGKQYIAMRNTLAKDLTNTDKIAMKMVNQSLPDVYALNMNYGTYSIEKDSRINTSFTLYNHAAVERLIKDNPQMLPSPKVDIPKDLRWNQQHIQSAITQGILQGKSIPKIAKDLQRVVGMDENSAIRNARTSMTGAQNAGRLDSMKRAAARGIGVKKGWLSTLDHVTRDSHVDLDGEVQEIDSAFSNGLMYPGDASGAPAEVYNCRCRLTHEYDKYKTDWSNPANRNTEKLGDMSYEQWKNKHKAKTNKPIKEKTKKESTVKKVTTKAEAIASLKEVFEDVGNGISRLNEKVLVETVNRFNELNETFGAVQLSHRSMIDTKSGKKAIASVRCGLNDDGIELYLNPKWYKTDGLLYEQEQRAVEKFWSMPCLEEQYNVYTITHEYGHIVEAMLSRKRTQYDLLEEKARKNIEDKYAKFYKNGNQNISNAEILLEKSRLTREEEKIQAANIRKEIVDIAKDNNKDFKLEDNLSRYGHTNDYEFFAEVFANSQCGKPNELGNAMKQWLEKEGY